MTSRSLDRCVLNAADLDEADRNYERLGFHVLPRTKHIEIGTSNRVIQFERNYLEFIGDLDASPQPIRDRMLPRFEAGHGLSIISLSSDDLEADREAIAAAGFEPDPIIFFATPHTRPPPRHSTGSGCRHASGRMPQPMRALKPPIDIEFCGLSLDSPIVLLSGCVGFGEEYTRVEGFSNRDVGAVVLKGTTGDPRLGNPPHRVFETPMGMLNSIGLQNPGVDAVVDDILPGLDFSETRFFANVSGSTIEEYERVTKRFDDSPIDAIEINISCPNVKEGGVQFGNDPDMSARVVAACRAQTSKPIITKLSPNQTDIALNAKLCIEAGSDALSVINTISGMAIDPERRKPVIGNVRGGLSGPAIKPIALLKVHEVHQVANKHGVPIIGQGGITTASDAIEFIVAGAAAVGVGTALFYDPLACVKINDGIADYLDRHGMASLAELVGTLDW